MSLKSPYCKYNLAIDIYLSTIGRTHILMSRILYLASKEAYTRWPALQQIRLWRWYTYWGRSPAFAMWVSLAYNIHTGFSLGYRVLN